MYEAFESEMDAQLAAKSMVKIDRANAIIADYQAKGYTLTLRQLFYQFVRRNWLANTENNYKALSDTLTKGRKYGLVDWDAIEDRTRSLRRFGEDVNPASYAQAFSQGYAEDIHSDQENYIEVWIEKDALIGVIERPCHQERVPYFACRGFGSTSEMYYAAKRHEAMRELGRNVIVLHFGDHDPSGMDMTRDNSNRLQVYARYLGIVLHRLALNMDQVKQYNLPPNPTKEADSRTAGYKAQFGSVCWELDALEPEVIADIVTEHVNKYTDPIKLKAAREHEAARRAEIEYVGSQYEKALALLQWSERSGRATL